MSNIKGVYELSIWRDVYKNDEFVEEKVVVIGSDKMQDASVQHRAYDISQKRNVNGSRSLTFKLPYLYFDTSSGEKVANPFVGLLANETKVKLKHNGKWYDYLIKNIVEDSKSHTCTYSAEDLFVNELSKNGFGVVLDRKQENNIGTNKELAEKVLAETDWTVADCDVNVQTQVETLYLLSVSHGVDKGWNILDPVDENGVTVKRAESSFTNTTNDRAYVLAFYSSCSGKPRRFQYIHIAGENEKANGIGEDGEGKYVLDADNYIINENCQYYIENPSYQSKDANGLFLPIGFKFKKVITKYQAKRYVFSQKTAYFAPLDVYVDVVTNGNKDCYYYKKSEYLAPTFITNLVSNNSFVEKYGWTGNCFSNTAVDDEKSSAIVEAKTDPDIFEYFGTEQLASQTYTSYLKLTSSAEATATPMVVEDSFYANRAKLKNLANGDKYVFAWRLREGELFDKIDSIDVAEWEYDPTLSCYNKKSKSALMTINSESVVDNKIITTETYSDKYDENGAPITFPTSKTYKYAIATVNNSKFTESTFKKSKVRTFFTLKNGKTVELEDFQIFEYIPDANDVPIFPDEQTAEGTIKTYHYYFDPDENASATSLDDLKLLVGKEQENTDFVPKIDNKCEKVREVSAKESNYFNILQSIAEKFECWLDIDVEHNSYGKVVSSGKKIRFKNYVGKKLPYGFRYGFNLQAVQRTNVSKALTTKLIVRQNSNELAKKGFCTIARANANPTGDTTLYDFSYYFNQGLMNKSDFIGDVYCIKEGYYDRIRVYNANLVSLNDELAEILPQLTTVGAQLQVAENGMRAASEEYEQAEYSFNELADFALAGVFNGEEKKSKKETIEKDPDLKQYYTEAITALQARDKYTKDYDRLVVSYDKLSAKKESLLKQIDEATANKKEENKKFYKKYSRFIQEGTWQSEEYIDDEKYYLDAQKTLYNSCWPQVTYNINVANLENHPDYKYYKFDLGDTTYIQDPEFFGYMSDGATPYRKEIAISEKNEFIDCPWKDTISVQTFKNQFQDLFKSLTASVQALQYSEGAYQKAAELAVSDEKDRFKFLEGAMNSAQMAIENAGDQTVTWDNQGITVTDAVNKAKQLRLVSGAMMFRTLDENGEEVWKTGITPEGVSADLITAGRIDSGTIQIMNKNDTSFRWDSKGITAYNVDADGNYTKNKGVRFNSNGLLGFDGVDSSSTPINEKNASFYLTEEGMKVQPRNFALTKDNQNVSYTRNDYVKLGEVDNQIYNDWDSNGVPIWEDFTKDEEIKKHPPFVAVMAVGETLDDGSGSVKENFRLYSDGTITANKIKLTGSVGWTSAASPNQIVYHTGAGTVNGKIPDKPDDGTTFNKFADDDKTTWHKTRLGDDKYYSKTTDGGATWSVVYSLGLDFDIYSDTGFFVFNEDRKPSFNQTATLTVQGPDISADSTVIWTVGEEEWKGQTQTILYTIDSSKVYEVDEFVFKANIDGTERVFKIPVTIQKTGRDGIQCYIESSVGFLIEENEKGTIELTARIFEGTTEIDPKGELLNYTWYINNVQYNVPSPEEGTKTITISTEDVKNKQVHFSATEKQT